MNLLINASEAMGGKSGEIHVRTGAVQRDGSAWTTLEIEDNGVACLSRLSSTSSIPSSPPRP